ncbi:MAG: hypothetical protein Q9160_004422 [Pyrenula sp. 1 TL-2023]
MLSKTGKYVEAATVIKDVFERRKDDDPNLQNEPTREALLDLCKNHRLGRSPRGLEEARKLYRLHGDLDSGDSPDNTDYSWRLRNAFNVVCVLVEQDSCDNALNELISVWRKRKGNVVEIESEIEGLMESFRRHKADISAMRALQIVCEENRPFSPPLVKVMTNEGLRLHGIGRDVEAINFLQKALTNNSSTAPQNRLKIGWPLALSNCRTKNFGAGANVVQNLIPLSNTQTKPSEHCLKALLAYALLASGQPGPAKQNAQIIWAEYKTQNILPLPEYHHADTLIRAMVLDEWHDGKWKNAKLIWDEVYQNAKKLRSARNAMSQVQFHVATGNIFAEKWESCRKTRSSRNKGETTAEKSIATIRKQINELQEAPSG